MESLNGMGTHNVLYKLICLQLGFQRFLRDGAQLGHLKTKSKSVSINWVRITSLNRILYCELVDSGLQNMNLPKCVLRDMVCQRWGDFSFMLTMNKAISFFSAPVDDLLGFDLACLCLWTSDFSYIWSYIQSWLQSRYIQSAVKYIQGCTSNHLRGFFGHNHWGEHCENRFYQ